MSIVAQALLALSAIGAIVIGVLLYYHKQTPTVWVTFASVTALTLAFCLQWQEGIWKKEAEAASAQVGVKEMITPAPTPALSLEQPTFRERPEIVTISIGGVTSGYLYDHLISQAGTPMSVAGFEPVRLHVKDGKMYADVLVADGKSPIEIKDNEFVVRPPDWDKNSNQNALEVVDRNNKPVFQLIYKSPTAIQINGIFSANGMTIFMSEDTISTTPEGIAKLSLKPIFKYPSWKYPGQYAE
jgi:hypothetical protein